MFTSFGGKKNPWQQRETHCQRNLTHKLEISFPVLLCPTRSRSHTHSQVSAINFFQFVWIIPPLACVKFPINYIQRDKITKQHHMKFLNEFLCLWLAQMRHEKGTCTASVLVRRAHVMVPVHGWQSVGILGHGCQAASLCRHTLLPLKIALQRRGGCTEGLTFLTTHSLATQEGLRLRIGAKNCPPERRGWRWRGRGGRGEEDAGGYGGNARVQSQASISHIHAGYVCMNMCIYECFLYVSVCVCKEGKL